MLFIIVTMGYLKKIMNSKMKISGFLTFLMGVKRPCHETLLAMHLHSCNYDGILFLHIHSSRVDAGLPSLGSFGMKRSFS
jgi:hypothetical protein